jgi:enoyl-CoA hydratase
MSQESSAYVRTEYSERVCFATLDRPELGNAYLDEDIGELIELLRRTSSDAAVDVLVLRAAGEHFCLGHVSTELNELSADAPRRLREFDLGRDLFHAAIRYEKPIVVALNGDAVGTPLVLALVGGDIIVAEPDSRFRSPHVAGALVPASAAAAWPLSIGLLRAKKLLLMSEWITAEDAHSIGLVTEVAAAGSSADRAEKYARRLCRRPQLAVRYTKRTLNSWLVLSAHEVFEAGFALEYLCMGTEDFQRVIANLVHEGE